MEEAASKALTRADVAEWYLKAGHRRVWVVPLSLVLSIFVIFLVLRRMAEDPYANLQKSRAEILTYKRELPDEKNALVAISETWKLRVPWDPTIIHAQAVYAFCEDKSVLNQIRTESYWKACGPELAALKQALKIQDAWSNFDPEKQRYVSQTPYFSMLNLRNSGNQLMFDVFMHANRGNHSAAAESLKDMHRLACHMESDPHLIACLVADAIRAAPNDDFWNWLLNEIPPLEDSVVQAYQGSLDLSEKMYSKLARSYEFERCQTLYWSDVAQLDKAIVTGLPKTKTGMYDALMYGPDRDCLNGVYQEIVAALRNSTFPGDTQAILSRHQRGPSLLARMNFGGAHRVWLASLSNHTYTRLLHTAFAVQLFQNKHKRDPHTLNELIPEFLKEVPKDFAGNPLKLKAHPFPDQIDRNFGSNIKDRSSLKLMIYSFGQNGKDEGGANEEQYSSNKPDDFSVQLRGAAERGVAP